MKKKEQLVDFETYLTLALVEKENKEKEIVLHLIHSNKNLIKLSDKQLVKIIRNDLPDIKISFSYFSHLCQQHQYNRIEYLLKHDIKFIKNERQLIRPKSIIIFPGKWKKTKMNDMTKI